jgi:outer membrane protein
MLRMSPFRFSSLIAGLVLSALTLPAQSKVVIIDGQKAMMDTAEMKKAMDQWDAKFKPRQDAMAALQKEIQALQQQLTTMAGKLQPQAEQEMTFSLQQKQKEFQRMGEDLQADSDRERTDILGTAAPKMQAIVEQLAASGGYDIILDISNTVYFKPALDITAEATAAYDKAHPETAAAR